MPLLFFNLVFVFLIFPLKGPLFHKFSLATLAYLTGAGWEYFALTLSTNFDYYLGKWSSTFFFVVNPFLELFWMISVWTYGLSVLASKSKAKTKVNLT